MIILAASNCTFSNFSSSCFENLLGSVGDVYCFRQYFQNACCFSGRSENQDGRPGLWLGETFPTSSLLLLYGIHWYLTRHKISTSSTKFAFFRDDRKSKMAALASDFSKTFSTSPLQPLNGIQGKLKGSKIWTSYNRFVLFRPIGKPKWPHWSLISYDIFDFFTATTELNY